MASILDRHHRVVDATERRRGRSRQVLQTERIRDQRQWLFAHWNARVLLVNCLPDEQEMYSWAFEHRGFVVGMECAEDVALDYALRLAPDAVVVDMALPGGGGVNLVKRLRAEPVIEDTVIVMVSSYVRESDRLATETAGADLFLTKPCLPGELVCETVRLLQME